MDKTLISSKKARIIEVSRNVLVKIKDDQHIVDLGSRMATVERQEPIDGQLLSETIQYSLDNSCSPHTHANLSLAGHRFSSALRLQFERAKARATSRRFLCERLATGQPMKMGWWLLTSDLLQLLASSCLLSPRTSSFNDVCLAF